MGQIGDAKVRDQIIAAGTSLEELGKIVANLGSEADRKKSLGNTLKFAADQNEKNLSF